MTCMRYLGGDSQIVLLVFHQEREQVGHRSGPHFAQSVVVETLVEADHAADVCLGNHLEAAVAIRRQRRRPADRSYIVKFIQKIDYSFICNSELLLPVI